MPPEITIDTTLAAMVSVSSVSVTRMVSLLVSEALVSASDATSGALLITGVSFVPVSVIVSN